MKVVRCKVNPQDISVVSNEYKPLFNEEVIFTGDAESCNTYRNLLKQGLHNYKDKMIID